MAKRPAFQGTLFTGPQLRALILPLIAEQFLAVTVGMADTMMVSTVGQAAVSGISLVDQINMLLIQIFAALATGGAVVASQYLGRRDRENAVASAKQLFYVVLACSTVVAAAAVIFNRHILHAIFGNVEPAVMEAAETYFWLSALSYPFLAVYNAGAALFRSMGNSKISLVASLIMNVINIGGNAILIYGFGMGVAGAAVASLVSRMTAAFIVVGLLMNREQPIYLDRLLHPCWRGGLVKSILRVGVPTGFENGIFQIGKLLVAGLIASYGTTAIAANAVCNNILSIPNIPGSAIGLAAVTVVGRCVGAGDSAQARGYTKLLVKLSYLAMTLVSVLVLLASPWLVGFYAMPAETTQLATTVINFVCLGAILFWTPSFMLPQALRAAGDAKFTMVVSMVSMWTFRVGASIVLGTWLGWGLIGVWTAMVLDWVVRMIAFGLRFKGQAWLRKKVIEN